MNAKANLLWRNQKLEFTSETVDTRLFDMNKSCLKISDRRSEAAIHKRKADVVCVHGYLVHVRLPDVSYNVLAAKEVDALDVFQYFLPMMEIDIAKHMWAVLRSKQMIRRSLSPGEVKKSVKTFDPDS